MDNITDEDTIHSFSETHISDTVVIPVEPVEGAISPIVIASHDIADELKDNLHEINDGHIPSNSEESAA